MKEEYPMLSVEEALARVLSAFQPLPPERVAILEALGRVLTEDVVADMDIPPLANSAMDGYAVRAADTAGASREKPVRLRIIYELAAGYTTDAAVAAGCAIRIMTGAPIPPGADAVVQFEDTEQGGEWVEIFKGVKAWTNVRPAGEDVKKGKWILPRGTEIRPQEVGMLKEADLFLTSGGVSMGDFDMVKKGLATEGEMGFWRVRMKPGKPLAFGQIRGVPLLGLPGNPVSAMVSFELFVRPAILKMLGKTRLEKPIIQATLMGGIARKDKRRHFIRVTVEKQDGEYRAYLTGDQGSGILLSMVKAQGLAIISENVDHVPAGTRVPVMMMDWPEDR
ncbi:MAG: molybdopterin molybdotransferase MoeA [Thermodesulfobacteriota bacterium]